jgi:hypothetical protein
MLRFFLAFAQRESDSGPERIAWNDLDEASKYSNSRGVRYEKI